MLSNIHHQIIQEKQLSNFLKGELQRQKENIDKAIRDTISAHRNFGLLDIWYPKLTEIGIRSFLKSPIFTREKRQVFDSPSTLPYPTQITTKINSFLKNYQNYIQAIIECASFYFTTESKPLPYIPCSSEIQFFSSSTFPALFGYGWCVEQATAYADAIVELIQSQIQKTRSVTTVGFRNSFIRDIIRQFMHTSGIQTYLRLSLANIYTQYLSDERFSLLQPNSLDYYEAITKYVDMFTNKMIEYLPFMPSQLRYFFSCCYNVAKTFFGKDSKQPTTLIEILFFDLLLQPALVNPKLFALIPETSVLPRTTHNTMLTKIFRWSTSPQTIPDNIRELKYPDSPLFQHLRMSELIDKLCNYDGGVEGIFSSRLQNVTQMYFHLLLMSMNDIQFIFHIINTSVDSTFLNNRTKEALKNFASAESIIDITSDELIDFWYTAFKLPPQKFVPAHLKEPPVLYLPLTPSTNIEIPNDNISSVIDHLIVYFEDLPVVQGTPETLHEFLEYQHKKAVEKSSADLLTKTQAVLTKMNATGASDKDILERVQQTLTKRVQNHSKEFASLFEQQELFDTMEKVKLKIISMNTELTPIVHQSLLRFFLMKNKNIEQYAVANRKPMCESVECWLQFFKPASDTLIKFSEENGLDATHNMPIVRQLHSTLVSMIPYNIFLSVNQKQEMEDMLVLKSYDAQMEAFLKEEYSPTLVQLFKTPSTFEQPAEVIVSGTKFGAPLERLQQIMSAMEITQNIYTFEAGEGCPGDDFLPLFMFVLIKSKHPHLSSLLSYLTHFLFSAEGRVRLLDSKENYCETTFRTSAEHIISVAIKTSH